MKAALPDRIPATVLFREIKERGYEGGETRLKLFVRGLTPLSAAAPAVRFETTPGHQTQADWATVGRGADRLSLFIATLGWSRQAYVEFCDDERVETLIGCHETAFLTFGGVPIEISLRQVPGAQDCVQSRSRRVRMTIQRPGRAVARSDGDACYIDASSSAPLDVTSRCALICSSTSVSS